MIKEVIVIISGILCGVGLGIILTIPIRLRKIEEYITTILIRTIEIDRNIFDLKEQK